MQRPRGVARHHDRAVGAEPAGKIRQGHGGRLGRGCRASLVKCGTREGIDAHELQGAIADLGIALDHRCEIDRQTSAAQRDVPELINARGPGDDLVRRATVHRINREFKCARRAAGCHVDRRDRRDPERKPDDCEQQLRRMAQQVPHYRRPRQPHIRGAPRRERCAGERRGVREYGRPCAQAPGRASQSRAQRPGAA
jgi:hypothetical protein